MCERNNKIFYFSVQLACDIKMRTRVEWPIVNVSLTKQVVV